MKFCNRWILFACVGCVLISAGAARAGDWPAFRGPTGLGYTDEKDLPLTWNGKTGENILWKTPLVGGGNKADFTSPGHSSPIVWRDRVFITTAVFPPDLSNDERRKTIADHHVLCFQASDGKQLWDTLVPPGKCVVENVYHGYAVPTPATDGTHVFALFGSGVIAALDFEGNIVWREELPRLKDVDAGICASPVLFEDTVIVPSLNNAGLRALEKGTGKLKWEEKTRDRNNQSTPALIKIQDKIQLIHYAGGIQGIDPATGDLLWFCHGPSVGLSSPAFGSGLLYADAGRGGRVGTAVDPTGTGDVSKTHIRWKSQVTSPAGSSPIVVGEYLYRITDGQSIKSWKMATGEEAFSMVAAKITPSSSPVACPDGRIYFASPRKSYVIKAGPTFEILATNELETTGGSQDYSSCAVSQGRIFMKGRAFLWCIGSKEAK